MSLLDRMQDIPLRYSTVVMVERSIQPDWESRVSNDEFQLFVLPKQHPNLLHQRNRFYPTMSSRSRRIPLAKHRVNRHAEQRRRD